LEAENYEVVDVRSYEAEDPRIVGVVRVEVHLASSDAASIQDVQSYVDAEDTDAAQVGPYKVAVQPGRSVDDACLRPFEVEVEFFFSFPSQWTLPARYPITSLYHPAHTS
jgi:hypothetical protein